MKLNLQQFFLDFPTSCMTKVINFMTILKINDKEFYINVVKWID